MVTDDVDTAPRRWSQIPVREVTTWAGWAMVAWGLGAIPVAVQLVRLDHTTVSWQRCLGIAFLGAALGALLPRWRILIGPLTAAALYTDRTVPARAMFLVVVSIGLWTVVLPSPAPVDPRIPRGARMLAGVPLVAAAVLLLLTTGIQAAVIATGVAFGLLVLGRFVPKPFEAIGARLVPVERGAVAVRSVHRRAMTAVRPAIGRTIGAITMLPAAVVVAVVWLVHRIVRFDQLAAPVRPDTEWVVREGLEPAVDKTYVAGRVSDPRAAMRAFQRLAVSVLLAALVAVPVAFIVWEPKAESSGSEEQAEAPVTSSDTDVCDDLEVSPVLRGQDGGDDLACEQRSFVSRMRFDALTVYDYPPFEGEWVNQQDGKRRTWTPPDCGQCRRITVWWFGGSAAWGWNQRDEYSLPSQLARLAAKRGYVLDVVNYAMPAWVLGQEVREFQSLLLDETPPDLVVFYDGGNELNRQKERNGSGRGTDESPTSWFEAELSDIMWNGLPSDGDGPSAHDKFWDEEDPISPTEVARHAVNRYLRDVEVGKRVGAQVGLEPVFVWQPLMFTAPRSAGYRSRIEAIDRPIWREMAPAAVERLPRDIVDLSDALDDVDRKVFDDFYHHNEVGARAVAAKLLDRLEPRLEAIIDAGP